MLKTKQKQTIKTPTLRFYKNQKGEVFPLASLLFNEFLEILLLYIMEQ